MFASKLWRLKTGSQALLSAQANDQKHTELCQTATPPAQVQITHSSVPWWVECCVPYKQSPLCSQNVCFRLEILWAASPSFPSDPPHLLPITPQRMFQLSRDSCKALIKKILGYSFETAGGHRKQKISSP